MLTTTDANIPSSNAEADVPEPFTTFTLFPLLPLELRRKIWRHALPFVDRMILVVMGEKIVGRRPRGRRNEIPSYFSYLTVRIETETSISTSTTGLRMLSVCHETRTEYLLADPKSLETKPTGGRIHYNPGSTIICIQDWHKMNVWAGMKLSDDIRHGAPIPSWIADIGRSAVPLCTLDSASMGTGFGSYGDMHNMYVFKGLKEWIGVEALWRREQDEDEIRIMQLQMENKKREIGQYKAAKNLSYMIPQVALLDINPTRTRYFPGL